MKIDVKRKKGLIIGLGVLSALLSIFPHIIYARHFYLREGTLVYIFFPGLVFGVFVSIVTLYLLKDNKPSPVGNILKSLVLLVVLAVVYVLVYFATMFTWILASGFTPIAFAVSGALGGLGISLGLLVVRVIVKNGMWPTIKSAALLGLAAGVPFHIFAKPGEDFSPFDLESSVLSHAFLFLIWQPLVLLTIYNQAKKKKEAVPNPKTLTPPPPMKDWWRSVVKKNP